MRDWPLSTSFECVAGLQKHGTDCRFMHSQVQDLKRRGTDLDAL